MSDHKNYSSLQTKTVLQTQWKMVFANAINHENIVKASVLEIFESHREQRPPIMWRANATEPGNLQEWGDFIDTTSIGLLNNYVLEPISPIELSQFWM